jgi:hypothetical protein
LGCSVLSGSSVVNRLCRPDLHLSTGEPDEPSALDFLAPLPASPYHGLSNVTLNAVYALRAKTHAA